MSSPSSKISSLITLIQDDDPKVASLAMEKLLQQGPLLDRIIGRYQESRSPLLRARIHQLSAIVQRREVRARFIKDVRDNKLNLWEGLCGLNRIVEPGASLDDVDEHVRHLVSELTAGGKVMTASRVASFMREKEFFVPEEDVYDLEFYLVEDVLTANIGSAPVVCALARHVSRKAGWTCDIVLHGGAFCLVDTNNHVLLKPHEGWRFSRIQNKPRFHTCNATNVLLAVLSRLFLGALSEGDLYDIYQFGALLSGVSGTSLQHMPYPFGTS